MSRITTEQNRRDPERGATVVEFAVIVALLLVILFGILEFAFIFYQRHFIANAAREGMRIGVRADNFNCFDGVPADECTASLDRKLVVEQKIADYLSALYQPADTQLNIERVDAEKALKVTVTVNNFFPQLLSELLRMLPTAGESDFGKFNTLTYSTTGRYEDPDEYDNEE